MEARAVQDGSEGAQPVKWYLCLGDSLGSVGLRRGEEDVVLWENGKFGTLGCCITDVGACYLVVLVDGEVLDSLNWLRGGLESWVGEEALRTLMFH